MEEEDAKRRQAEQVAARDARQNARNARRAPPVVARPVAPRARRPVAIRVPAVLPQRVRRIRQREGVANAEQARIAEEKNTRESERRFVRFLDGQIAIRPGWTLQHNRLSRAFPHTYFFEWNGHYTREDDHKYASETVRILLRQPAADINDINRKINPNHIQAALMNIVVYGSHYRVHPVTGAFILTGSFPRNFSVPPSRNRLTSRDILQAVDDSISEDSGMGALITRIQIQFSYTLRPRAFIGARSDRPLPISMSQLMARRGVISLHNTDGRCVEYAIMVSMLHMYQRQPIEENLHADSYVRWVKNWIVPTRFQRFTDRKRQASSLKLCSEAFALVNGNLNFPSDLDTDKLHEAELRLHIRIHVFNIHGKIVRKSQRLVDIDKNVCIVVHENHAMPLTMPWTFAGRSHSAYCYVCEKSYSATIGHSCIDEKKSNKIKRCSLCGGLAHNHPEQINWISCADCGASFPGKECFDNHNAKKKFKCDPFKYCKSCRIRFRVKRPHVCGHYLCKFCERYIADVEELNHTCPIRRKEPDAPPDCFLFFDIEACLEPTSLDGVEREIPIRGEDDGIAENTRLRHRANCIVFRPYFRTPGARIVDEEKFGPLKHTYIFACIETACDFLFQTQNNTRRFASHNGWKVYAHNCYGYDVNFFLRHMFLSASDHKDISAITNGLGFKNVVMFGVQFGDTAQIMSGRLSDIAKYMNLQVRKGFFPYRFNVAANKDYHDEPPPYEFFPQSKKSKKYHRRRTRNVHKYDLSNLLDPEHVYMDPSIKSQFNAVLERLQSDEFKDDHKYSLFLEILLYCINDVDILEQAWVEFDRKLIELTGVSPANYLTIAQVSMAVNCSMIDNTAPDVERIHRIPEQKSTSRWQYKRDLFYDMIAKERPKLIRDMKIRQGEHKYVVLAYDPVTRTAYDLQPCLWMGCRRCKKKNFERFTKTKRERWNAREIAIRQDRRIGKYECTSECEFGRMHDAIDTSSGAEVTENGILFPRATFYGGHTETYEMYWNHLNEEDPSLPPIEDVKNVDGESILDDEAAGICGAIYVDYTSLYPWVMSKFPMPTKLIAKIRYPTDAQIYVDKTNHKITYGLYKCTLLPPQHLKTPTAPVRVNNRLVFPLCRTCAKNANHRQPPCTHSPQERMLIGAWNSIDLEHALELGYKILKVVELHSYHSHVGCFARVIEMLLKWKTISSGNKMIKEHLGKLGDKNYVVTEEDKAIFCHAYNLRLSYSEFSIAPEDITSNPVMRAIAKLLLNSMWGKYCSQPRDSKTQWIFTEDDLVDMIHKSRFSRKSNTRFVAKADGDFFILLETKCVDSEMKDPFYANIPLGSFTTAGARRILHDAIIPYQHRIIYADTDSMVVKMNAADRCVKQGVFLGQLTNELGSKNAVIKEFVSTAPKCYSYVVQLPETMEEQVQDDSTDYEDSSDEEENDGSYYVNKFKGVPSKAKLMIAGEKLLRDSLFNNMKTMAMDAAGMAIPEEAVGAVADVSASDSHDNDEKSHRAAMSFTFESFVTRKDRTTHHESQHRDIRCKDENDNSVFCKRQILPPIRDPVMGILKRITTVPWGYISPESTSAYQTQ